VVRSITISAEAEEEIYTAYDWYEVQESGLGERFEIAVRRAIHAAAVQPEIYPLRFDDVRRVSVKKFPYSVLFEYDECSISVLSVFHQSQNPSRLNRLKKF
jgi:toxin ParE1/3/4